MSDPHRPAPADASGLAARISCAAIVANVRSTGLARTVVDLRRDARGHGLGRVASALLRETDATIVADAADIAHAGLVSPRVLPRGAATVTPDRTFGWDGVGRAAMTLTGSVLAVKHLRAGEGVSYGYAHRAPHDTQIALVSGGYAQGVVRALGNRAEVSIAGARHPIVGRVAMDVCVVDVGMREPARGAEAVFFGAGEHGVPTLIDWARATGLTAAELCTAVGLRVRREYGE